MPTKTADIAWIKKRKRFLTILRRDGYGSFDYLSKNKKSATRKALAWTGRAEAINYR